MGEIINPRTGERTPVVVRIVDPIEREVTALVQWLPSEVPEPADLDPAEQVDAHARYVRGLLGD